MGRRSISCVGAVCAVGVSPTCSPGAGRRQPAVRQRVTVLGSAERFDETVGRRVGGVARAADIEAAQQVGGDAFHGDSTVPRPAGAGFDPRQARGRRKMAACGPNYHTCDYLQLVQVISK